MTHDAGPARGRLSRLRRRFPRADAVDLRAFAHSPARRRRAAFRSSTPAAPPIAAASAVTRWVWRESSGAIAFEHVQLGR